MNAGVDFDARDSWTPARLIPAGKMREEEQETRATSSLLSVMPVVPEFGHGLLAEIGAPRGQISTFTEIRLKDGDGRTHIPDGAILVERGKTRWACLVEVKTGRSSLEANQVERYLGMAREHGFDAVLTISNQIRSEATNLPYDVDKRKVGKLQIRHISWWRILTEAIIQHRFRGVSDPEQAWILNELIRYLDDPRSGASGFEGMGEQWVPVRDAARHGTLRPSDDGARAVAARWEQFIEYLCLHLSQELGVDVKHIKPRGKSPEDRVADATKDLADAGVLVRSIRVPDAVGPVTISADLRARLVTTSVEIDSPKDRKRPRAKINWILRQVKDASDDLRIDVRFTSTRRTSSELLGDCRDAPERLLLSDDPSREPRTFLLARSMPMGKKAGLDRGSFAADIRKQATDFYRELVQELRPPPTEAPKLPEKEEIQHPPSEETSPATSVAETRREQAAGLGDLGALGSAGYLDRNDPASETAESPMDNS
jgi:hypothetical protein